MHTPEHSSEADVGKIEREEKGLENVFYFA